MAVGAELLAKTFLITDPFEDNAFRGELDLGETQAEALTIGDFVPDEPVVVRKAAGSGNQLRDVVWTTFIKPIFIHKRIAQLLEESAFTGWTTYPVLIVVSSNQAPLTEYAGLRITGRCGPIDDEKSPVVEKDLPGGRFPIYKGLYFEPASWDGSDVFASRDEAGWEFVLDRVRDALIKAKVTNLRFEHVLDVERHEL